MRVVRTILGILLLTIGLPLLLAGGGLWTAMQHRDAGGAFSGEVEDIKTSGYAVVVPDIDGLLRQQAPFARGDQTRLRVTADTRRGEAFVGVAPRADVAKFLAGVAHTRVDEVKLARGTLPVRAVPITGEAAPATGPRDQRFWVRGGAGALEWSPSDLRGKQLSLVVMTSDGGSPEAVSATVELRPGWLNSSTWGLLVLGSVMLLLGILFLGWPTRAREIVYVVEPSQVPDIAARLGVQVPSLAGTADPEQSGQRPATLAESSSVAAGASPRSVAAAPPKLVWPPVPAAREEPDPEADTTAKDSRTASGDRAVSGPGGDTDTAGATGTAVGGHRDDTGTAVGSHRLGGTAAGAPGVPVARAATLDSVPTAPGASSGAASGVAVGVATSSGPANAAPSAGPAGSGPVTTTEPGTAVPDGGAPESIGGVPESIGGVPESIGGVPESIGGAPESIGGVPESSGGAASPTGGAASTPVSGAAEATGGPAASGTDPAVGGGAGVTGVGMVAVARGMGTETGGPASAPASGAARASSAVSSAAPGALAGTGAARVSERGIGSGSPTGTVGASSNAEGDGDAAADPEGAGSGRLGASATSGGEPGVSAATAVRQPQIVPPRAARRRRAAAATERAREAGERGDGKTAPDARTPEKLEAPTGAGIGAAVAAGGRRPTRARGTAKAKPPKSDAGQDSA